MGGDTDKISQYFDLERFDKMYIIYINEAS